METKSNESEESGASRVTPESPPVEASRRGIGSEGIPDQLRFGDGKREWVVGIIFGMLGTVLTVGFLVRMVNDLFDPTLAKIHSLKLLAAAAFGLLFAYVGYYFLLWKDQISLHRTCRLYRRARGWGPWAKVQQGNFSDFACIRLWLATNKRSGRSWHASLHWKADSGNHPPFELFKYRDPMPTVTEANRLAAALEIALDSSAVEAQERTDSLENQKRLAWRQRLRPYTIGLATVIVLLIINSLVPGLHWRDSWTNESGNVFERWSTLFHTLTRVESAARPIGYSDVKWFIVGRSTRRSGFLATKNISTSKPLNYHWRIGVGHFPPPEASIGEARAGEMKR